jgi:DNA-directed RNA polymerase specialized sigma24 family protein
VPAVRDEEYAAVVERERPLIQATAYLLTGDAVRAERLVQKTFAELYGRFPRVQHPRLEALRAVAKAARGPIRLPWEARERVELVDGPRPVPVGEPIVADLRMLAYDQRVAIVLESYAELAGVQIADVLERPVDDVLLLARKGRVVLAAGHPERASDEELAQELRNAIPYDMRESHGSASDVIHGRQLNHRRWIQRASAALLMAALIVVAAVWLVPARPPVPQAAPSVPISTPSSTKCDPATDPTCRSKILFEWRTEMAEVAASHLDPKGEYFSGFRYHDDDRYGTPSFWAGHGGALAFEMFWLDKGATKVYLQVATSRRFAVRCGATTNQQCTAVRFMDGNLFRLSDSATVFRGIEVQYNPTGDEVITAIARNTQRGQVLEVSTGDLVKLLQDPRLRLPNP